MKATLKVLSLLALSSGLASAASTTLAAYYDTSFRTSTGTLLGSGFTARIGLTSATSFSNTADFAAINATWTPVSADSITFQTSAGNFAGYFSGVFSYSTNAGSPIVLWVSDGANNNFVARLDVNFENSANAPFDSNTYDITSSTVADNTILLGSYSTSLVDGFDGAGGNLILNNAIPEPASALLGAIGVLGMLRRRRI
jgi:hypothetical protein